QALFENLSALLDSAAMDESENEIVRLELVERVRSALQQYATKFKLDGVPKEDMLALYDKVSSAIYSIETTVDTTEEKKDRTISLLDDTKAAILSAYDTKERGKQ
ncbi:MAG: serine/threonine protein kinase, partial [Firmicutes bacterium]|nr:serine/threonine protein kinase [Bacillota bacterium]